MSGVGVSITFIVFFGVVGWRVSYLTRCRLMGREGGGRWVGGGGGGGAAEVKDKDM
mgnify:CR=1 FL=1